MLPASPAAQKHFEGLTPDACADCEAPIYHGYDRYFQRNDPEDGSTEAFPGLEEGDRRLAAALAAMTYDAVCDTCGDKALRRTTAGGQP